MPWVKPYHPAANQRLERSLYGVPGAVCFITVRAYHAEAPFVCDELNRMTLAILREEQARQHCLVFTYCLMPDHLHFLISPQIEGASMLVFVDQYKGKTTNASWRCGWHGKLWEPRFYDHVVRGDEDLREIAEYILANPVRQNLVGCDADWQWSGAMNPLPM
jgi:putative transposase